MINASSSVKQLSIGAVFTPLKWAKFAIQELGLFRRWMEGATIFDPTMGEGNLLEALIQYGLEFHFTAAELPIHNLYGVELNTGYFETFFLKIKEKYGISLPRENYINEDIFFLPEEKTFDIIFGNPPWQNFVDLPAIYKHQIRNLFFEYDLVGNSRKLLLGGARIDIAALVIQKVIQKNLKKNGEALFFMPLSLLLNEGANQFFRTYKINHIPYRIPKIYDFNDENVFEGISTRYGLVHFQRDIEQIFPIPFRRMEKKEWKNYYAKPLFHITDPLSIVLESDDNPLGEFQPLILPRHSAPRQGINTCGANDLFFFEEYKEIDAETCCVSNKEQQSILLPKEYVHPLLTGINFRDASFPPKKWVLIPYNNKGKALTFTQIQAESLLHQYLLQHKERLANRKGVLMQAQVTKGIWWAMQGIGAYNYAPYKVVWEAYGKTEFRPIIVEGTWQANQSLQAFIPTESLEKAKKIHKKLQDKRVEDYLLSLKMEGTMNWAQPGKIKKLISYEDETLRLF